MKNLRRFSERLIKESIIKREVLAKESIIEGRAINLALLDKNLLLKGHCPGRIFEDIRSNSAINLRVQFMNTFYKWHLTFTFIV